jgi:hypothetical protein
VINLWINYANFGASHRPKTRPAINTARKGTIPSGFRVKLEITGPGHSPASPHPIPKIKLPTINGRSIVLDVGK